MGVNKSATELDSGSEYQSSEEITDSEGDSSKASDTPTCSDDEDETEDEAEVATDSKGKGRDSAEHEQNHANGGGEPGTKRRTPNEYVTSQFQAINKAGHEVVVEVPRARRASKAQKKKDRSPSVSKPSIGMLTPAASSPITALPSRSTDAQVMANEATSSKRPIPPTDGSNFQADTRTAHKPSRRSKTAPPRSAPVLGVLESPVYRLNFDRIEHARAPSIEKKSPKVSGSFKQRKAVEDSSTSPKESSTSAGKRKRSISVKNLDDTPTLETPSRVAERSSPCPKDVAKKRKTSTTVKNSGDSSLKTIPAADVPSTKSKPSKISKRSKVSTNAAMDSAAPRDSDSRPKSKSRTSRPRQTTSESPPQPMATRRPPNFTDLPECSNLPRSTTATKPTNITTFPSENQSDSPSKDAEEAGKDEVHIKIEGAEPILPPNTVKWKNTLIPKQHAEAAYTQSKLKAAKLCLETDGLECHDDAKTHRVSVKHKSERAQDAVSLAMAEQKRAEAERQLAEMEKNVAENERRKLKRKLEKRKRREEKERKRLTKLYEEENLSLQRKLEALESDVAGKDRTSEQRSAFSTQRSNNPKKELREEGEFRTADGYDVNRKTQESTKPVVYVVEHTSLCSVDRIIAGVKLGFPTSDFHLYRHTLDKKGNARTLDNWAVEFVSEPSQVRLLRNGLTLPNTSGRVGKDWWCPTYKEAGVCSFCKGFLHKSLAKCHKLLFERSFLQARPRNKEVSMDGLHTSPQKEPQSPRSDGVHPEANTSQPPASEGLPTRTFNEDLRMFRDKHCTRGVDQRSDSIPKQHGSTPTAPGISQPKLDRVTLQSQTQQRPAQEVSAPLSQLRSSAHETDLAWMLQKERTGKKAGQLKYRRREVQPLRTLPEKSGHLSTDLQNPTRRQRPSNLIRREVAVTDSLPACVCRLLHDYFANGRVTRPCLGTFPDNEVEFWENIKQIVSCRGHEKEMITYCQGLWDGEQARRNAIASTAFEKSPPPAQQLPPTRQPSQPPAYGAHIADQFVQRGPRWGAVYGPRRRETIPAEMFYGPSASRARPTCVGPEPAASSSVPQYRQRSFREFEGFLNASQSSRGVSSDCQQRMIELD